jgi:hypothetical protein
VLHGDLDLPMPAHGMTGDTAARAFANRPVLRVDETDKAMGDAVLPNASNRGIGVPAAAILVVAIRGDQDHRLISPEAISLSAMAAMLSFSTEPPPVHACRSIHAAETQPDTTCRAWCHIRAARRP